MSTSVASAVGTFVWHEHVSADPQRAQQFYADLLGWEYTDFGEGYTVINSGGQGHGGFPPAMDGVPPHWLGSVQVEDTDGVIEKAKSGGGNVVMGPMDIPDVGRYAVVTDPQGGGFSVIQVAAEGGPMGKGVFVWDELATSDVAAAKTFYSEVLGWSSEDMDMGGDFTYTIFKHPNAEQGVGGAMPQGEAPATMWLSYIDAPDIDATAAKAKELGATVMREPFDIENIGRIAIVIDPTGAAFGLFKSASS
jgi:predicted enzyme related to lactoylglutathione lyase